MTKTQKKKHQKPNKKHQFLLQNLMRNQQNLIQNQLKNQYLILKNLLKKRSHKK